MSWGARDKTHRNPRRGRSAEAQARAAPPGPYTVFRRAETGEATPESAARSRAHLSSTRCGARPLATGTSATAPKLRRSFLTTAVNRPIGPRMRRTWVRAVVCGLVLGAASSAHAYFLDEARNFEIRLRAYAGLAIATESSRERPRDPPTGNELPT